MSPRAPAAGSLPVTRISRARLTEPVEDWSTRLACVEHILEHGLAPGRLVVLVGENGSGKSTLIEGIAQAYGLSPEGGSTGARHSSRPSESDLWRTLWLDRGIGAARWGFFLRAETMHGFYSYLEANPAKNGESAFHEMSHGESFLEVLATRFNDPGLYLLDEPESALSFSGCLALVGLLHQIATSDNAQAIVATHSPILAATPGAQILEVGSWGLRESSWRDLELVQNWSDFLAAPESYLRYVLTPDA
jgi:predicted ATPase